MIDAQKDKVSTLEKALNNAASSFGENDRRTLAWQTQLNNANAELNNMERELKESQEEVKKLNKEKIDKLVGGLKEAGDIAGKTLVAGLKAAAAAIWWIYPRLYLFFSTHRYAPLTPDKSLTPNFHLDNS